MYCRIELNSAYTTEVYQPYILNRIIYTVALVSDTPYSASTHFFANDNKLSATFGSEQEICLLTDWTFSLTLENNLVPGDSIILKFPRDRFTFLMSAISNIGRTIVIDNFQTN